MRTPTPGSLRAQLFRLAGFTDPWDIPRGSDLDRLVRGLPVTFTREQLESMVAPADRTVDLAAADAWTLTGDDTLTAVE